MNIPFVDDGASFSGCNCLGLYALILANEAGVTGVPALNVRAENLAERVAAEIASGDWMLVARGDSSAVKHQAKMFDAIEMTVQDERRAPLHVGCAIGGGMMIHTERDLGPRCLPMDHRSVARRIVAVWRPKALMGMVAA